MARLVVQLSIAAFLTVAAILIVYHQHHLDNHDFKKSDDLVDHPLVSSFMDFMILFGILLLTYFLQVGLTNWNVSVHYTAIVLTFGFLLGILGFHNNVVRLVFRITQMSTIQLIFIYLPIMLFNISFCLDVFLFVKTLPQIVVIGILVALSTACIFGILAKFIIDSEWHDSAGILFGIFSIPVYPKAITAFLKHQSTRTRQISVLLEGEALFTFVIADISQSLVLSYVRGFIVYWYQFVFVMLRFVTLGPLTGFLFGKMSQYFLKKMYTDRISIYMVCFGMPMVTFIISEKYASGCGSIAVVVLGAMLGLERTVLTKEIERFLVEFWDVAGFVLDAVICFICAVIAGSTVLSFVNMSDYVLTFGVYLLYYIVRFICFLSFSPIISRLGYGMDLKNMIVVVWCGLKSPFSLVVIDFLDDQQFERKISAKFYLYIMGLYFISTIINATFTSTVMDFLGLTHISTARQMNMNNCMKHLFAKRERTIAILKMDRLLADTNWPVVLEATNVKHPYKLDVDEDEEDNFLFGFRFTYCEECRKDVPLEPTPKEMAEMTREAKMRILKAKKMSYARQYENGMMSKNAIRVLSQAIELGMDSPNAEINVEDLYKKFSGESWFQRLIREQALKLKKKSGTYKPPQTYWRRLCYHLVVTNRRFDKIILLIVFINVVVIVVDAYIRSTDTEEKWPLEISLFAIKFVFLAIYIVEMVIRILAYSSKSIYRHGIRTYFKSVWNIIDFAYILMGTITTAISVRELLVMGQPKSNLKKIGRKTIGYMRLTRAIKLLRAFEVFYPDLIEYLERSLDKRMAFAYELGKSYATGEVEILDMLTVMIDNKKIRDNEQHTMEQHKVYTTKLLGVVQKERPWIAITVKTKQAIRTILNGMSDAINSLRIAGWADTYEYDKLNASMNDLYKRVNAIKKVQPSPPKVIFKEVAWMADDEAVIDFLFENVTAKKFEPGDVVFGEGTVSDGIYIVVTGLFMITYTPDPHVLSSLHEYGRLPIVDYISGAKYDEPTVDYIVSGNCIGELSTLTARAYNSVVVADSHSQVYVLSRGVLNRAMELSSDPVLGLQCRIWKEVANRIAIPLLLGVPAYQGFSQNQIKFTLERAFVPELTRFKIFAVTDLIEDIVLIEGLIFDYNTRETYVAPCYIPRTVQKLILPTSSLVNIPIDVETKLMIIPAKDVDEYDVMLVAEETCEMVNTASSKCLHHTIQRRLKRRGRSGSLGHSGTVKRRHATSRSTTASSFAEDMNQPSGITYFQEIKSETFSFYLPADDNATNPSEDYEATHISAKVSRTAPGNAQKKTH